MLSCLIVRGNGGTDFDHGHMPRLAPTLTIFREAGLAQFCAGTNMTPILKISGLTKTYASGFQALKGIDLEIYSGEIFALLGPNGAGKTTLISIVCGLVNPSDGSVHVGGHDIIRDYRQARALIGLVPQELTTDAFETVWNTVSFSRGLFGKKPDPAHIEKVLRSLSLWEKKDNRLVTLSGGMIRRVLIAEALSNEPRILFLDVPTAGVNVSRLHAMSVLVRDLRDPGVTIILTTHYIEEAEEMADRVGVINRGDIILVQEKHQLMQSLGKKELILMLDRELEVLPPALETFGLRRGANAGELVYTYDSQNNDISALLAAIDQCGLRLKDIQTQQSSLEDIFVELIGSNA